MNAALHDTPTGKYWLPTNTPNCTICQDMAEGRVFDKHIVDALRPHIRKGSVVVDLGACFGQMSVLFSGIVGRGGQVISVESNPEVFGLLAKNLWENTRGVAKPYCAAAWERSGDFLEFPIPVVEDSSYGCFGMLGGDTIGSFCVPSLAVDDLEYGGVSAIKVDVQGADLRALRGCVNMLRCCRPQPAIVFEYEEALSRKLNDEWAHYTQFLDSCGYRIAEDLPGRNFLALPKSAG